MTQPAGPEIEQREATNVGSSKGPHDEERRRSRVELTIERWAHRLSDYFGVTQLIALVIFVGLIFIPPFLSEPPESATAFDHFTEFANLVLWGIWFPLVLLSVILVGRLWCGLLCPQGAVSEWASRIGLHRPAPAWMRWEGTPIVSFVVITVLGQTLGVRDHPEAVLELFGGTMLGALVVGLIYGYRQRIWCRHLCPIGLLLGIFSRLGAVHFAFPRRRPGGDRYADKGICPTLINIRYKAESRHCIECFKCVKPEARGSVRMTLRRPGEEVEAIQHYNPNFYESMFLFVGTGIALGGFLWLTLPQYHDFRSAIGNWFFDREWFWIGESGPAWLMSVHPQRAEVFTWVDFFSIIGFMLGVMAALALLLLALTALSAWLAHRLGGQRTLRQGFVELSYQYTPVAMISLILGLGGVLFEGLGQLGLSADQIGLLKMAIFALAFFWSVFLGDRVLLRQGLRSKSRWLALSPGVVGTLVIGAAWGQALF